MRTFHEQPCNPSYIVAQDKTVQLTKYRRISTGMVLAIRMAVGLWFTAGRRKCWGEPGRHFRMGHLRGLHPVFFWLPSHFHSHGTDPRFGFTSDARALRVFQRQLQFPGERIDGGAGLLPHALALETHVA